MHGLWQGNLLILLSPNDVPIQRKICYNTPSDNEIIVTCARSNSTHPATVDACCLYSRQHAAVYIPDNTLLSF